MAALAPEDLTRDCALVGGEWVSASETIDVFNPSTGDRIGCVPALGREATGKAIEAAQEAFPEWSARSAQERAQLLDAWHDLIQVNKDSLSRLMTIEQGKPLAEAASEIQYSASFVDWFAEEAIRAYGEVIPPVDRASKIIVEKYPVGVCAAITPWNFPSAMITRKVAPALAAGCTIVVKPSELTPFSALALGRLAEQAGIPAGVLNIVTGYPTEIGHTITSSETVRKLSFTGSTRVGKMLFEASGATIKRLSLELGGNSPFLIFADADLDLAVDGVIASKFRNAGQTCVCANRIFVHDNIYDEFSNRLVAKVEALTVGDGLEPGVVIGPLINATGRKKVDAHVHDALRNGGKLLTGGPGGSGNFYTPSVIGEANDSMRLFSEETFGPVAPLFRFKQTADVVVRANGTPFGLAAYVYTRDISRGLTVMKHLNFGMVGLNAGSVSVPAAPFGGVKASGIGREGSRHGLDEYLDLKALHIGNLGNW